MTIPAVLVTAAGESAAAGIVYVEIEGLPYAYGNAAKPVDWFPGSYFLGIKPWLRQGPGGFELPELSAAQVDHAEGRVEIGQMRLALVDVDDSLAGYAATKRRDGWLRLSADVTATDGTVSVAADSAQVADWPSSGTAWIGREAMTFARSGSTLTVTRNLYGSTATDHAGPTDALGLATDGAIVTQYPRSLVGRRVWLRWGLDATDDDDCTTVWTGRISSHGWEDGGATLVLLCDDLQYDLKRQAFRAINAPWQNTDGTQAARVVAVVPSWIGGTVTGPLLLASGAAFSGIANGDEVIATTDTSAVRMVRRTSLDAGAAAAFELVGHSVIVDQDAGVTWPTTGQTLRGACAISQFVTSPFTAGVHPLEVALQVLTSRLGDATNSNYDTLPEGYGLGINANDLDLTQFERLAAKTSDLYVESLVVAPVDDAREWLVSTCLRPFGFFMRTTLDGLLSVGQMGQVGPSDVSGAVAITADEVAVDGSGRYAGWEGPIDDGERIYSGVSFAEGSILRGGKIERTREVVVRVAEDWSEIETSHSARVLDLGVIGTQLDSRRTLAASRLADLLLRYGKPPTMLGLSVTLDRAVRSDGTSLDVGDLVTLTLPHVPSAYSATRGLTSSVWEVWQRRVDLRSGVVALKLAQTAIGNEATRYIAPAMPASAYNAGTKTFTVGQSFTTGSLYDSDAFAVGDVVRIYTSDLNTRSGTATIQSKTSTTVTINATPGGYTFASGDVILHADFAGDSQAAAVLTKYAFRAGNDRYLGTTSAPHVLG